MNDVRFDPSCAQPACQPEAIAAGFECNDHTCNLVAELAGFVTPTMQQLEQSFLVGCELLQWITSETRDNSSH